MGNLRRHIFEWHKEDAKAGYEEDAKIALQYIMNYIEKSNMPRNIKEYTLEELSKILSQKDAESAFYIKQKSRGKRPQKAIRERNIKIAESVYNHKLYQNGNLRNKPLSDEVAIEEITNLDQLLSEQTIRNAYYEHKKLLEFKEDHKPDDFL